MAVSARQDDGPAIQGYDLPPELVRSAAGQHRSQRAQLQQSLLDVGHHGEQALQQTMVAGGRVRTHLEPRSGKRIFRTARPTEHLSSDAERPDQCGQRWAVPVQNLVGQDLRHVRGPWDLRVTPYLRHQSGQPFGRTFVDA